MRKAALLGILLGALVLSGCAANWTTEPVYTKDDLKARCERTGGWWRPNILDGHCEYELAQMP